MQRSSTRCLLDRLEQLYVDMPTEGFFSTPKYVQVAYKPPPPKVFVETTTQDQLEDIESTKQKITENLQKINDMQKKAFEAQMEKMKICYDFFGKYEGSLQSTDWARSFWFGLHYVEPPKRYDARKQSVIKTVNPPKDWVEKMRFGRPADVYIGMDPNGDENVRKALKGYNIKKNIWEEYVDAQWDTAFDDAFGVSEFQAFLATIPEKINVDLETTPAENVITMWFELYQQTRYFLEKISMDHVHCEGIQYDEIVDTLKDYNKRQEIGKWKGKPEIVQRLYEQVEDLQDNVEILDKLTQDGWMPNIITYADGKEANMYTRYDPITRTTLKRKEPPVKMKRTLKRPTAETKTKADTQKPTDKKTQVAKASTNNKKKK
jgi:hypothetical protein